jgi:ACT domain-containing protein
MKKSEKSISRIRIEKEKLEFIEQIKKTPIIQVVCEKLGVGRATFYRWKSEDKEFSKQVDEAFMHGKLLINDLAESQLISSVKDKSMYAITYWLRHHHPEYSNTMTVKHAFDSEELTDEQKEIIKKALSLSTTKQEKDEPNT